jgi:hypothetical protein
MTTTPELPTDASALRWLALGEAAAPLSLLAGADRAPEWRPDASSGLPGASQEWYNRAADRRPEVRMRPYRIVEEAPDEDEEYPQVVPLGVPGRPRSGPFNFATRPRPWTPRETVAPPPMEREPESPLTAPKPGLTRTHQLMIGAFVVVCVGMLLGMVMVRVWDDASRAVAALPPAGSVAPTRAPGAPAGQPATGAAPEAAAPEAVGGITTEIRVLQPNYTVAPGDTLGIIARKHGTSVDALASINNLENRNSLSVGQKLIIP